MRPITVIIPTYNRTQILYETLNGLRTYIRYGLESESKVHILVSDDSTDQDQLYRNLELSEHFSHTRVIAGPGRGLGANLNFLLSEVDTDIVLQMDDDHVLSRPLDITQYVKDLRSGIQSIGWIRLMFGEEVDVSNLTTYYKFSAKLQGRYWFVAAAVDELYVASNRPHLKLVDFHSPDNYGPYNEGVRLGETETSFCHQYQERHMEMWKELGLGVRQRGPSYVVIPFCAPPFGTWKHVGVSWQHTIADN